MNSFEDQCIEKLLELKLPPMMQEKIIKKAKLKIAASIKKNFLEEMKRTVPIVVTDRLDSFMTAGVNNTTISYTNLDDIEYDDSDFKDVVNRISLEIFDHIIAVYGWGFSSTRNIIEDEDDEDDEDFE